MVNSYLAKLSAERKKANYFAYLDYIKNKNHYNNIVDKEKSYYNSNKNSIKNYGNFIKNNDNNGYRNKVNDKYIHEYKNKFASNNKNDYNRKAVYNNNNVNSYSYDKHRLTDNNNNNNNDHQNIVKSKPSSSYNKNYNKMKSNVNSIKNEPSKAFNSESISALLTNDRPLTVSRQDGLNKVRFPSNNQIKAVDEDKDAYFYEDYDEANDSNEYDEDTIANEENSNDDFFDYLQVIQEKLDNFKHVIKNKEASRKNINVAEKDNIYKPAPFENKVKRKKEDEKFYNQDSSNSKPYVDKTRDKVQDFSLGMSKEVYEQAKYIVENFKNIKNSNLIDLPPSSGPESSIGGVGKQDPAVNSWTATPSASAG